DGLAGQILEVLERTVRADIDGAVPEHARNEDRHADGGRVIATEQRRVIAERQLAGVEIEVAHESGGDFFDRQNREARFDAFDANRTRDEVAGMVIVAEGDRHGQPCHPNWLLTLSERRRIQAIARLPRKASRPRRRARREARATPSGRLWSAY